MPTEADIEQLFLRVAELEAWRKVQQGEVKKEAPKEATAKPGPFPAVPPKPTETAKPNDNDKASSYKK